MVIANAYLSSLSLLQAWRARQVSKSGKALAFAELARRGKFKSRAYVRELFTGSRKLSTGTVQAIAQALKLSESEKELLLLTLRAEASDTSAILKVKAHYAKERRKAGRSIKVASREEMTPVSLQVYAAVSCRPNLRTVADISKISGISPENCVREISLLTSLGWVVAEHGQFRTQDEHVMIDHTLSADFNQKWFLHELEEAAHLAKHHFTDRNHTLATYKFSVDSKAYETLQASLRSMLRHWMEKHMSSEGDRVVSLTVCQK